MDSSCWSENIESLSISHQGTSVVMHNLLRQAFGDLCYTISITRLLPQQIIGMCLAHWYVRLYKIMHLLQCLFHCCLAIVEPPPPNRFLVTILTLHREYNIYPY